MASVFLNYCTSNISLSFLCSNFLLLIGQHMHQYCICDQLMLIYQSGSVQRKQLYNRNNTCEFYRANIRTLYAVSIHSHSLSPFLISLSFSLQVCQHRPGASD